MNHLHNVGLAMPDGQEQGELGFVEALVVDVEVLVAVPDGE